MAVTIPPYAATLPRYIRHETLILAKTKAANASSVLSSITVPAGPMRAIYAVPIVP